MGAENTGAGSLHPEGLCVRHSISRMHRLLSPVGLMVWERSALEGHLGASVGVTGALEAEKMPPLPLVLGQGSCGGLWYSDRCLGHTLAVGPRPNSGQTWRRGGWVLSRPSDAQRRPGIGPGHGTVGGGVLGR